MSRSIPVFAVTAEFSGQAAALATRMGSVLLEENTPDAADPCLRLGPSGLELCVTGLKPTRVEFGGDLARRGRVPGAELLVKAMGRGPRAGTPLVDATAGLGRDAFLLAAAGFEVTLLEREPVLHALLEDGLSRAMNESALRDICSRMRLLQGDAQTELQGLAADIVYLDPMFPERDGSAAVGRESQLLRLLAEPVECEEIGLLNGARSCAGKRVVVKRHRNAPVLAGEQPAYQLRGRATRFDIYLCS